MPGWVGSVVYVVGIVVSNVTRVVAARQPGGAVVQDRRSPAERLLMGLTTLGMIILPALFVLTPWLRRVDYTLPGWATLCGTALLALSIWLLWRAHADLGRNWSATPAIRVDQTLVTDGVFRLIRHPMYASHWLWALAQPLLLPNWLAGFAMLVCYVPFYVVRVPREEALMLAHFGEPYRRYAERTGRVLPRWRRQA